ncbi:unnamed protein product, partial [Brachionus calyciflorus]
MSLSRTPVQQQPIKRRLESDFNEESEPLSNSKKQNSSLNRSDSENSRIQLNKFS